MKFENSEVIFESTGRRERCLVEEFSCDPDDPGVIHHDCDGYIGNLAAEERAEVAKYMIGQWQAWLKNFENDEAIFESNTNDRGQLREVARLAPRDLRPYQKEDAWMMVELKIDGSWFTVEGPFVDYGSWYKPDFVIYHLNQSKPGWKTFTVVINGSDVCGAIRS